MSVEVKFDGNIKRALDSTPIDCGVFPGPSQDRIKSGGGRP